MHVLIASPLLPWPLSDGGRVAQFRILEAMRDAADFTLAVPVSGVEEQAHARSFAEKFPEIKVVAVPCFDVARSASRLGRALGGGLARKLQRIMFPPPKEESAEKAPWYPFNSLPPSFVKAIEKELAKGCDIFQAEFADFLTLGPLLARRVPSVFVHHQLHFVYARRFLEERGGGGIYAQYLTRRMIQEEAAYLNTFDSAIVMSEVDREALLNFCPALEVSVSPFPSPEDPTSAAVAFEKPECRFIFVASELHGPNCDGLRRFMREAWPGIKRALPTASMEVIGKWSDAAQKNVPNFKDITFSGFVPELLQALRNKIMVVPIWVGSGIRTKILAAWSASCPVITTTVGVEGLPGRSGDHFIVADDASAFVSACVALSSNVSELNRIAANGLELVQKQYSLKSVRNTRLEVYEKLLAARRKTK